MEQFRLSLANKACPCPTVTVRCPWRRCNGPWVTLPLKKSKPKTNPIFKPRQRCIFFPLGIGKKYDQTTGRIYASDLFQTTLYTRVIVPTEVGNDREGNEKAGAAVRTHGAMCNTVVQTVLLYGSEILVMMGVMLMVLEGFYHQAAIRIAGKKSQHDGDGGREYPPV